MQLHRVGRNPWSKYLTTLEEVNLTGCTLMKPGTVPLQHNRAMRSCCLSGSNATVKYDNDWSKNKSALQLITYHGNDFGLLDNCLVQTGFWKAYCHKVCMEASVVGKNKCVAIVIFCVVHDEGWSTLGQENNGYYRSECFLDAWIVRKGQEVFRSSKLITLKHVDSRDQAYLCTLNKIHPLVKTLKYEDKIQVAAQSIYQGWAITVECGSICIVYGQGEEQVIFANSRLLDVQQLREKFVGLILVDNSECLNVFERARRFKVEALEKYSSLRKASTRNFFWS